MENMKYNKVRVQEVLQREIGIALSVSDRPILATTRVESCTIFYGHNKTNKVGFLCHFDYTWTTNKIPELYEKLRRLSKDSHEYEATICGGNCLWWCKRTRRKISDQIKICEDIYGIKMVINWQSRLRPFRSINLTLDTATGLTNPYFNSAKIRVSLKDRALDLLRTTCIWFPTRFVGEL